MKYQDRNFLKNEESYLKHIKENFKPDPATIREKQLKKLGI